MYLVYSSTRKMERRMTRYSVNASQNSSQRSRKVMEQSLLFSAALLITLAFQLVEIVIAELGKPIPIWIHVLFALTNPLQGMFVSQCGVACQLCSLPRIFTWTSCWSGFYNLLIHLRRGNGFSLACKVPRCFNRESAEPKKSLQQTSATTAVPNSAIVHTNKDTTTSKHISSSVSFALEEAAWYKQNQNSFIEWDVNLKVLPPTR